MHELSISRNIVAIVTEAATGRPVARVVLEVGRLSGVAPEALAFCFDLTAQDAGLQGVRLDIVHKDGRARCHACNTEFPVPGWGCACPCGSRRTQLIEGAELLVKAMELA